MPRSRFFRSRRIFVVSFNIFRSSQFQTKKRKIDEKQINEKQIEKKQNIDNEDFDWSDDRASVLMNI